MPSTKLPDALEGLTPVEVWRHFYDLTQIPRCSGNEAAVRRHIAAEARAKGVAVEEDEVGNLLLRAHAEAPGTSVCLQGHMDMVCVAEEGLGHDFEKDPIRLRREDGCIYAQGTTLGADNGIGLAYGLALIDVVKGPLEILCTVDEEVGLVGASNLRPGWLRSPYLINLDSEEEEFLTVACSGGRDLVLSLPRQREAMAGDARAIAIKVKGLRGGHSGLDIGLGRSNAIKILNQALAEVGALGGGLLAIDAGVKRNAIPPVAIADVAVPAAALSRLEAAVARVRERNLCPADPDLRVELVPSALDPAVTPAVTGAALQHLNALLDELPHGVQKQSPGGQPFVSINLALVSSMPDQSLRVITTARSPAQEEIDALEERVRAIARAHGGEARGENGYPGWEPNYSSPLLATTRKVYQQVLGHEPKVLEVHAGLECGIIGSKYPSLDMISLGPDIRFPHSPREHISIPSVERIYGMLVALIAELQRG